MKTKGFYQKVADTMENNCLIAEFMGYRPTVEDISDNRYDTSWDWLMEVVEKIEAMGFQFWIGKYASSITKESDKSFGELSVKGDNKLSVIYQLGIQFIKLHNTHSLGTN